MIENGGVRALSRTHPRTRVTTIALHSDARIRRKLNNKYFFPVILRVAVVINLFRY